MVVFGLGKNFLFKSALGHCDFIFISFVNNDSGQIKLLRQKQLNFSIQNTVAQILHISIYFVPIKNQGTVKTTVWIFLIFSCVKYEMMFRFKWCAHFGTLYFDLKKISLTASLRVISTHLVWHNSFDMSKEISVILYFFWLVQKRRCKLPCSFLG